MKTHKPSFANRISRNRSGRIAFGTVKTGILGRQTSLRHGLVEGGAYDGSTVGGCRRAIGPFSVIHRLGVAICVAVVAAFVSAVAVAAPNAPIPEGVAKAPAWQAPSTASARVAVFAWLDQQKPDRDVRNKAEVLWAELPADASNTDILVRAAQTFALTDENARKLFALCSKPRRQAVLPAQAWLADPQTPALVANNLRLLYGLWLAQQAMFDESLGQLGSLKPADVIDPASLLFYQAVAHHQLLHRDPGLHAIQQLLDGGPQSPTRYLSLAKMMQTDLQGLKDDTLDHIARRMDDVRRRLDLGRAGKKVLEVEDGVIASLDKLIKQLEEQQKRQQANSAGGGNMQSNRPAQDSQIMGGKGPGEVDKKKIGNKSGWGDLPPKQREEALQQIGREFPTHYRDLIEQYFRKLASEGAE